ncbi:MAG: TIGR01212 family radical SAM protein [Clostridia bacterium]|nr:TIGR01212 family radical SAM protein [Clostridia bacterium]
MKRYKTLNNYLKGIFKGKIAKIPINAGFSCPNRENGGRGCLFCSDSGGSEFSGDIEKTITEQIVNGKKMIADKWDCSGFISFFQNFSNTFANTDILRARYNEAIEQENIVGIAVATRPDCFSEEIYDLLEEYNRKTFLWIELGLQTSSESTAELIERGYGNDVFENTIRELKKRNIKTVIHLIAGLPGEDKRDFLDSIKYINNFKPWGIKLHNIYIQKNSRLFEYSQGTGFQVLKMEEYIDWVTDALMYLDKDVIVHRLTGDPDRKLLVAPDWIRHKLKVLSEIDRVMILKNATQGCLDNTNCHF